MGIASTSHLPDPITLKAAGEGDDGSGMHFFYLDESGDTGDDLLNPEQPIMVLGGVSVKDTGWNTTHTRLRQLFAAYFDGDVPEQFELHASQLLCPEGEGPFLGHPLEDRLALARQVLDLVAERGHSIHAFGIDKATLMGAECPAPLAYDDNSPWLLAYDYLITYINWYVKERLGQNSRGMLIHDVKTELHHQIERIAHNRRFEGPQAHRVKWVVEFSYPVDSTKNPMIQISDLVTFCIRRFLESENGYRPDWTLETRRFYAECFAKIDDRIARKGLVERPGAAMADLNNHLAHVRSLPPNHWRASWGLN